MKRTRRCLFVYFVLETIMFSFWISPAESCCFVSLGFSVVLSFGRCRAVHSNCPVCLFITKEPHPFLCERSFFQLNANRKAFMRLTFVVLSEIVTVHPWLLLSVDVFFWRLFSCLYFVPPRLLDPPSSWLWPGNRSQRAILKDISILKMYCLPEEL